MIRKHAAAWVSLVLLALAPALPALAQKAGGTLRVTNQAGPSSLSVHEEASITAVQSTMAMFNNLVMFDPFAPRNSVESIIPDLAESWSWDATGTRLTFKLLPDVTWHDGKPFTAKDVQCTWHRLMEKEQGYFRRNPRRIWYDNLKDVVTAGDHEVTFVLGRPQPSLLPMLASGFSPVFPCHVSAKNMRTNPVGTGPFKFQSYKANEMVRLQRNPAYWKKGRPYLDAIEQRIVPNRATRVLGLMAAEFDLTPGGDMTVPVLKDLTVKAPHIRCTVAATNTTINVLVNNTKPPFNDVKLRRALTLGLDRQAFIDIMTHGAGKLGGAMMAAPEGSWGMTDEVLAKLPGYAGTLAGRQAEARRIMGELGYGPEKRLRLKVSTRDFTSYKEPAVILVDQLSRIFFDPELETVDSGVWFGRAGRGDFAVALNITGVGVDDPDVTLAENFACRSDNNFTKYCNPEVDRLLAAQSAERDTAKRLRLVWDIERVLAEEVARPIIYHGRSGQCWQPYVKGFLRPENGIYNHWRLEQVWLDK